MIEQSRDQVAKLTGSPASCPASASRPITRQEIKRLMKKFPKRKIRKIKFGVSSIVSWYDEYTWGWQLPKSTTWG